MKHLLVTNDFPPKVGGIQTLLWEWWRRLPSDSFAVLTTPHAGSEAFDRQQSFESARPIRPLKVMASQNLLGGSRMDADPGGALGQRRCH
jgi:phosphatidylinositol alpha-1,6-mannosyltransferase